MVSSDRRSENNITNDSSCFSNVNIELNNVTEENIHLFKVWYQAKYILKYPSLKFFAFSKKFSPTTYQFLYFRN